MSLGIHQSECLIILMTMQCGHLLRKHSVTLLFLLLLLLLLSVHGQVLRIWDPILALLSSNHDIHR
jgi:hypothetical protein